MEEKKIHRPVFLDEWQFEKLESWLSAQAEKGWRLVKMGRFLATFRKGEPGAVRYRCDVKERGLERGKHDREYEQAGWRIAATAQQTVIYFSDDPAVTNPQIDPIELADNLKPKWNNIIACIATICLFAAFLWVLYFYKADPSSYLNYTETGLLPLYLLSFLVALRFLSAEAHKAKIHRKLMRGQPAEQGASHRRSRGVNAAVSIVAAIVILPMIAVLLQDIVYDIQNRYSATITGIPPILTMSDLDGGGSNNPVSSSDVYFISINGSLLVPYQYELRSVIVSERFDALLPCVAARLAGMIVKEAQYFEKHYRYKSTLTRAASPGFDEVWTCDDPGAGKQRREIVARKGRTVFYMEYVGTMTTQQVLPLLRAKLGEG